MLIWILYIIFHIQITIIQTNLNFTYFTHKISDIVEQESEKESTSDKIIQTHVN